MDKYIEYWLKTKERLKEINGVKKYNLKNITYGLETEVLTYNRIVKKMFKTGVRESNELGNYYAKLNSTGVKKKF